MTTTVIGDDTGYEVGVVETAIRETLPTQNEETSYIRATCSAGNTQRGRTLFKFTGLANITGPVTVSSAVLTLMVADTDGVARDVSLRKLLVPFVEAEATWNIRSTGNNWGTAGASGAGDADSTVLATGTIATSNGSTFTVSGAGFDSLVEGWINGTVTNDGCILSLADESTAAYSYLMRQSEDGTASRRPYLTVTYTAGSPGPTVTSVTQTSGGTEGSPAVMTVALSGATSGSTNFAATLAGVTATGSGTDFTSDLASATYSNGVTFSGGNMVVPDAVSGWTVTIATTSDTLDEADETATLTVGGTAGTLTITDDDAAPTITGTASSTVTAGDPVVITYSPGLSGQTRTYTLALTDGTAVGGTDYDNTTVTGDFAVTAGTGSVSISGSTVTVDPGVTEFTLTITTTA